MDSGMYLGWLKNRLLSPVRSLARGLGSTSWGLVLPALAFSGMTLEVTQQPQNLSKPIVLDLLELPSEGAIPKSIPIHAIDENDPVWRFRYVETGTEFRAGIPYWIFRIMPKIFPEEFQGQGYEHFGFTEDDQRYYASRPVPRGMSLSDTSLRSQLLQLDFFPEARLDQLLGLSPSRVFRREGRACVAARDAEPFGRPARLQTLFRHGISESKVRSETGHRRDRRGPGGRRAPAAELARTAGLRGAGPNHEADHTRRSGRMDGFTSGQWPGADRPRSTP